MENFLSARRYTFLTPCSGASISQCCQEAAILARNSHINVAFLFNNVLIKIEEDNAENWMEQVKYYMESGVRSIPLTV